MKEMKLDGERLKLLAAALALVISTATVQFTIATFVNKVRDEFGHRGTAAIFTFSELYDWFWGYTLGIAFNIVFFVVADILKRQTADGDYKLFGVFLWWLYLVNLIAWIAGMIHDNRWRKDVLLVKAGTPLIGTVQVSDIR